LGLAAAAITKVARRYRWQLLIKVLPHQSTDPVDQPLQPLDQLNLTDLRSHCPASVRLTIDVDPLNLA
jgi:primosomal protein N' (replication factor Y) (superfamily II helicase)